MQKKVLATIASVFLSAIFLVQCNSNDDNGPADPIIGTWRLVEVTLNSQQLAVSNCDLMELYIFGADQFSHELYGGASGRIGNAVQDAQDDDSEDDESDDEASDDEASDDDPSDDENSDDTQDDSTDDASDDGGTGGGSCVLTETLIGNWANTGAAYMLDENGTVQNLPIHFTDNNTRFYYETTNGTTIRRYIFQRQ